MRNYVRRRSNSVSFLTGSVALARMAARGQFARFLANEHCLMERQQHRQ